MHRAGSTGTNEVARSGDRCVAWLENSSIVFPVAALVVTLLSFLTVPPTPGIVGLFAVALVPWALLAGGVRVPALVLTIVDLVPVTWLVAEHQDQGALFLLIVAVCWSASHGARWATWIGVVGGAGASVACNMANDGRAWWVIWTTGMLFAGFAGALLRRQRSLTDALTEARQELAAAALAHERQQIAREVHDIVGHSLTVVLLNVVGARRQLSRNPELADQALARAETISRESLDTVRSVVGMLASDEHTQSDAPLPGGVDVLPLIDQARRSGLPVRLTVAGELASLEPAIGLTLVRVLQEALSNASRHAHGATVEVDLVVDDDHVTARVANILVSTWGEGEPWRADLDARRSGLGLSSMADRVDAVQGSIETGPVDGRWIVRAVLPRSPRTERRTGELAST